MPFSSHKKSLQNHKFYIHPSPTKFTPSWTSPVQTTQPMQLTLNKKTKTTWSSQSIQFDLDCLKQLSSEVSSLDPFLCTPVQHGTLQELVSWHEPHAAAMGLPPLIVGAPCERRPSQSSPAQGPAIDRSGSPKAQSQRSRRRISESVYCLRRLWPLEPGSWDMAWWGLLTPAGQNQKLSIGEQLLLWRICCCRLLRRGGWGQTQKCTQWNPHREGFWRILCCHGHIS